MKEDSLEGAAAILVTSVADGECRILVVCFAMLGLENGFCRPALPAEFRSSASTLGFHGMNTVERFSYSFPDCIVVDTLDELSKCSVRIDDLSLSVENKKYFREDLRNFIEERKRLKECHL